MEETRQLAAIRKKLEGKAALAQGVADSAATIVRQLRAVPLPRGLTQERLTVLVAISEKGSISISDLAQRMKVRSPTMSYMVSSIAREGFVRRKNSKTDGRGVLISLTPRGRQVLRRASQSSVEHIERALGKLSKRQVAALMDLALTLKALSPDGK
jgi:DNA-binding MarR family transcriptional regulator